EDDLADRLAVDEALDVLVGEGGAAGVVFGDPPAHGDTRADLAVDLDDEFDDVDRGLGGVERRPVPSVRAGVPELGGGFEDAGLVAEPFPELFGQVWREGGDQ